MVVGKLLERNAEADYGYNAANNTYEDLVKAGIIDPLKVSSLPQSLCMWRVLAFSGSCHKSDCMSHAEYEGRCRNATC